MSTETADGGNTRRGPAPTCLHELVETQARCRPDQNAVLEGDRGLTFGELDRRADTLAGNLRWLGVDEDVRVGLCCERSIEMAVGFLAILKAGGTCVPLDPLHPSERLRFVVDDADVRVVVTQDHLSDHLPPGDRVVVCLNREGKGSPLPTAELPVAIDPENTAYVLYTSGSTGRPKGVALTHRGLVNHAVSMSGLFELSAEDRVLQFASIAFDLSVEELFAPWYAGAVVVLRPQDLPVLGEDWDRWLRDERITVMDLPTGYWERWVRELSLSGRRVPPGLRLLVVGGEQPSPPAHATWLTVGGDRVRWLNTYGPTEASVVATWYEPPRHPVEQLPIGRPIDNVTAFVLDTQMSPVPAGSVGELYLGGAGVAKGYLGRPDLTAAAFVPDPFSGDPCARLFKTGDRARRLPDGNLEFLGRIDQQLKVRGARVEPGEVEVALMTHPAVDRAVVVGREDATGELRLVAYCLPRKVLPSPSELRAHLGASLPDQLVPSAFVSVEQLPLSLGGKVERAALPCPPTQRPALGTDMLPPRTPTESVLANVWAEVLELEEVGVEDNFFDLGGHSLLALQAVFLAQQRLGVELPANAVMQARTVATLARHADAARAATGATPPPVVPLVRAAGSRVPLSLQQEWMWALENRANPPGLYNVTVHQRLDGPAHMNALREALNHLLVRHEALRTVFWPDGESAWATVGPANEVELRESDLTSWPPESREAALQRALAEHNREPFSLSSGALVRARFFKTDEDGGGEVALTCDHLVSDGVSVGILLHELREAYAALRQGRLPSLRPLPVQYADFASWQRRWITEDRLELETAYWKQRLAGMPLGPGIPFDRHPAEPGRSVATRRLALDHDTYGRLVRLAHASGTSLFPLCVAAVQALVNQRSGRTDVAVSTMHSGRQRRELEGVVGLFAGVARLRTDLSGDPTFRSLLDRVRNTLLEALEHQNVPFALVRKALLADNAGDPGGRPGTLPVDVQYFPSSWDNWQPGTVVLARHPRHGQRDLYFGRGQRHPLMVGFFDDRRSMWATVTYKTAFYDDGTMDGVVDQLRNLLVTVSRRPDEALSRVFPR